MASCTEPGCDAKKSLCRGVCDNPSKIRGDPNSKLRLRRGLESRGIRWSLVHGKLYPAASFGPLLAFTDSKELNCSSLIGITIAPALGESQF